MIVLLSEINDRRIILLLEKCWAAVKVELGVMRELRGQRS